jgi:hypothetical protein
MLWDLDTHRVSLPEKKRLKSLRWEFQKQNLLDVERIHGSLCYISFIYRSGRSRLSSLSNFASSFHGNEFIPRYPPHSLISDLKWWGEVLQKPGFYRQLTSRGSLLDLGIFVDASTSWGIGIIIDGKWLTFQIKVGVRLPPLGHGVILFYGISS